MTLVTRIDERSWPSGPIRRTIRAEPMPTKLKESGGPCQVAMPSMIAFQFDMATDQEAHGRRVQLVESVDHWARAFPIQSGTSLIGSSLFSNFAAQSLCLSARGAPLQLSVGKATR